MAMSKEEFTLFFNTFVGEFVQITTGMMTKEQIDTEQGSAIAEGPVILGGYLLDEDDKYYYLGPTPDGITDAIKKVTVKHIQIIPPKSKYDEIMDKTPEPSDEKEIN